MSSVLQEKSTRSYSRVRSKKEKKALTCLLASAVLVAIAVLSTVLNGFGLTILPVNPFLTFVLVVVCIIYPAWYCYYLTTDDGKVYKSFASTLRVAGIVCTGWNHVYLPDIEVKDYTIRVPLTDVVIRKKLEAYTDELSSALPPGYVISVM